jgi:predicted CoA-binding protein
MFRRAAKDLELECSLLSILNHSHIIQVFAKSALVHKTSDCQLSMDALPFWSKIDCPERSRQKLTTGTGSNVAVLRNPCFSELYETLELEKKALLEEQLQVADAVASALHYMHEQH